MYNKMFVLPICSDGSIDVDNVQDFLSDSGLEYVAIDSFAEAKSNLIAAKNDYPDLSFGVFEMKAHVHSTMSGLQVVSGG